MQVELNQRRYLDLDGRAFPAPPQPGEFDVTQQLLASRSRTWLRSA